MLQLHHQKKPSFWLAKQIARICLRITLIIAQICREIAAHNDDLQWLGQDLQQAWWPTKALRFIGQLPLSAAYQNAHIRLRKERLCFSKPASTSTICGDERSFAANLFGGLRIKIRQFIFMFNHRRKKSLAVAQMFGWPQNGMSYVALVIYILKEPNRYLEPVFVFLTWGHSALLCNHT